MDTLKPIRRLTRIVRAHGAVRWILGAAGLSALIGALIESLKRPGVIIRRSVEIHAPVDLVYDFWKRFDNYPRFMSEVREVSVNEQGGLHWVAGPAAMPIQWNADLLGLQPNQRITWRSVPGSILENEGDVRLHALGADLTRVDVELSYSLPAGVLGYAVVNLLGFDPRSKIDSDLEKMRELIEEQASRLIAQAQRGRSA